MNNINNMNNMNNHNTLRPLNSALRRSNITPYTSQNTNTVTFKDDYYPNSISVNNLSSYRDEPLRPVNSMPDLDTPRRSSRYALDRERLEKLERLDLEQIDRDRVNRERELDLDRREASVMAMEDRLKQRYPGDNLRFTTLDDSCGLILNDPPLQSIRLKRPSTPFEPVIRTVAHPTTYRPATAVMPAAVVPTPPVLPPLRHPLEQLHSLPPLHPLPQLAPTMIMPATRLITARPTNMFTSLDFTRPHYPPHAFPLY